MTRLAVALALILGGCSGPGLLSTADGVLGGGRGVQQAGEGIGFGRHGQTLDVWRPTRAGAALRPVVIFWYGGGWVSGSRSGYRFAGRAFAANGFVVVVPDYRKVPSVRFPAFLEDGAQAVRWTSDHIRDFGGDPDRIALVGHSAGAYTAVMLALDPRYLRDAGVAPTAIKAAIGLSGPYDFYPFTDQRAVDAMAGVADPLTTQPIHYARADAPPMLLVTSDKDDVVRPYNAVHLADRLRSLGARVALRDYPGLGHAGVAMALSKPFRGKAPVLADSVAFLNRTMPAVP